MAELTISADDIQGAIASYVSSFEADTGREEIGTVIDAGDGIAHVEGLPSVMTQELLEFAGGVLGVALNLDEHSIGAVILGEFDKIEQGMQVKRTGEVLSVPVGDAFMGRVVNPLGQPIDGRGDIAASTRRALEVQAPSVVQRQSVRQILAAQYHAGRVALGDCIYAGDGWFSEQRRNDGAKRGESCYGCFMGRGQ
jgi:F-type H+-transporting ATPase subunit alpha